MSKQTTDIQALVLDVDGVLTSGLLYVSPETGEEWRAFHTHDGFAIRAWIKAGKIIIVCSGKGGGSIEQRMQRLGVQHVLQNSHDKRADIQKVLDELQLDWPQVAAIGDDLMDLPVLRQCGLAFAPANARPEVQALVDVVLTKPGGHGAVREAVEQLMQASGAWLEVLRRYDAVATAT